MSRHLIWQITATHLMCYFVFCYKIFQQVLLHNSCLQQFHEFGFTDKSCCCNNDVYITLPLANFSKLIFTVFHCIFFLPARKQRRFFTTRL